MCGIVGYIGEKQAAPLLFNALKNLEYRGYDSAGFATIAVNKVLIEKDIGKLDEIQKKIDLKALEGNIGISHCRWATHGKVTQINAHPHTSCDKKITLVHNGIIENYEVIKKELEKKGHTFQSGTDTEVIVHLIEDKYKGNLEEATREALKKVKGSYAFGIISSDEPDKLVAARKDSPLIVGVGKNEQFIASDVPAILSQTKKVIFLEDEEIAVLKRESVTVTDLNGKEIKKEIVDIDWDETATQKQGYPHFMLKEIFEQPRAIEETINGRIKDFDIILDEEIGFSTDQLAKFKRIVIVACGTSWHAGIIGEFMLEELAQIPVEVEYASEFRYRNPVIDENTLVIAISQSGETADTLEAIKEARRKKAKIISIVNVKGSSIARASDAVLYTYAGPEIGVASTKAFTSQLVLLYLLTIYIARIKDTLDKDQLHNRIRDVRQLPLLLQSFLENTKPIEKIASHYYKKSNALYLGRGINYPIALEGALKLKEVSYIHAEGYPAAEMKHGPIALIDKEMPVVFIATKDTRTYDKVLSNIEEVKARGGIILTIATEGDKDIKAKSHDVIYIPKSSYILTPILAVVPLQLIAYHIAAKRGCDIDKPRNLAKSVTVE